MNIDITLGFTPRALDRYPALAKLRLRAPPGFSAAIPQLQRGDQVALQRAPNEDNFVVMCRVWEIMDDEASLTILLGLADEPRP